MSRRGGNGVVWAVRYVDRDSTGRAVARKGSLVEILADEIDRLLDSYDRGEGAGEDWTAADLAKDLIYGLDMGASGDPGYCAENEVVRGGNHVGVPMLQRLTEMAQEAVRAERAAEPGSTKAATARGRVTGLAQALAFVRNPTAWENSSGAQRVQKVKDERMRVGRG